MKAVNSSKNSLTRSLTALVVCAMLNLSGLCMSPAFAATAKITFHRSFINDRDGLSVKHQSSVRYGIDVDKVPFAEKADGTKARYVSLCASHIKLQVSKGESLGEVEFRRLSPKESLLTYAPTGGDTLSVRSAVASQAGSSDDFVVDVSFELKGHKAAVTVSSNPLRESAAAAETNRNWQILGEEMKDSIPLTKLMREANAFLSGPIFAGFLPLLRQAATSSSLGCSFDCAVAVTECLGAAATYVGGMAALIELCGPTLGLTCVIAIVSHPILAGAVGLLCTQAIDTCQSCNTRKLPGDDSGDYEIILP